MRMNQNSNHCEQQSMVFEQHIVRKSSITVSVVYWIRQYTQAHTSHKQTCSALSSFDRCRCCFLLFLFCFRFLAIMGCLYFSPFVSNATTMEQDWKRKIIRISAVAHGPATDLSDEKERRTKRKQNARKLNQSECERMYGRAVHIHSYAAAIKNSLSKMRPLIFRCCCCCCCYCWWWLLLLFLLLLCRAVCSTLLEASKKCVCIHKRCASR